jgi:hypothetical protein
VVLQKAEGDYSDRVLSDQIVLGTIRQEAGPQKRWPKELNTKLTQGGPSGSRHSDQMVLVMIRWEAGPHERRPKALKEKLENSSRKPRA